MLLVSCSSFFSSRTSVSLQLPEPTAESLPPEISLEEVSKDPHLYKLRYEKDESISPWFMTTLKECGLKKSGTLKASARQLLVGLKNLSIQDQKKVEMNRIPLVLSLAEATLDNTPLLLASYSVLKGDCSLDLIVWGNKGEDVKTAQEFFDKKVTPISPQIQSNITTLYR